MPTLETYRGDYLWHYVPNLPAAVVFAALFSLATAVYTWKMATTRMWFCVPFVIGGLFEVIGFVSRAASTYSTGSLALYLIQAIFLLLPPVLFAASLYMVYSRVVRAVQGESFSLLSPRRTTAIFVLGDWLCLNI
ncbi:RTA1-domain-containing protein [Lindgomyces ingoldianus]|uniref:RTA1-domain-containing protein n=1 Tax=Lindgomyces ingoldianus TaxID=673940 RepID=A0ACB6QR95_9PLEO|nr:RTA1-domain-containing protein [Lindgomyces ingoldianus]KAF2468696.1 RTA1-domain-containing protein [Lindgomyces ingoldianus]